MTDKNRNAYEAARRKFDFHLAEDAIMHWLEDKPHLLGYLEDLEERAEALEGLQGGDEVDAWIDEATAAADAITDEVRRATGDAFTGTRYNALAEAARERLNINW